MPCYVRYDDGTHRAFVRMKHGEIRSFRAFGPKLKDHPTVDLPCPACSEPMAVGSVTTLIALGPGKDTEARERARENRWFNAIAIELHFACATGMEITLSDTVQAEGNRP